MIPTKEDVTQFLASLNEPDPAPPTGMSDNMFGTTRTAKNERLTAEKARQIVGSPQVEKSVQDHVDDALKLIEACATKKKRVAALHGDFWAHEGYSKTASYMEAVKTLEDLGYGVEFFYEDRQLVDMYTTVKW